MSDNWNKTSVDIEIIQTEGFDAAKKVDPNMVIKKKNGKDEEVQEGWQGHILPFELVQKTLLKAQYESLKQKKQEYPILYLSMPKYWTPYRKKIKAQIM